MAVEEKAKEYFKNIYQNLPNTPDNNRNWRNDIRNYIDGYNEAMRWRDIFKELPDKDIPVLVKNANNKYRVSQLRIIYNADQTRDVFFSGDKDFTDTITHWRPIE